MKRHRLNVTFTISASLHIRESALVHSTSGLGLTGYDLHCGENLQNYLLFRFQVKRFVIKKILKSSISFDLLRENSGAFQSKHPILNTRTGIRYRISLVLSSKQFSTGNNYF